MMHPHRQAGFSMFDLAIVLVMIGITLAASVPALTKLSQSNRLVNTADQLAGHLRLARQKAVARGVPHIVFWDEATQQYVIVVDQNRNGLPDVSEPFEGPFLMPDGVHLANSPSEGFTSSLLSFTPGGAASESGTMVVSNDRGDAKRLSVLAPTGNVRVR
jgi:type II secretory pathway pseudopilin PulG